MNNRQEGFTTQTVLDLPCSDVKQRGDVGNPSYRDDQACCLADIDNIYTMYILPDLQKLPTDKLSMVVSTVIVGRILFQHTCTLLTAILSTVVRAPLSGGLRRC